MTPEQITEKLVEDLGLQECTEEERQQIIEMVSDRFNDVTLNTLMVNLNPEQQKELAAAFESGKDVEQTVERLASEVPNLDQEIEAAIMREYESLKFMANRPAGQ